MRRGTRELQNQNPEKRGGERERKRERDLERENEDVLQRERGHVVQAIQKAQDRKRAPKRRENLRTPMKQPQRERKREKNLPQKKKGGPETAVRGRVTWAKKEVHKHLNFTHTTRCAPSACINNRGGCVPTRYS